jgi:hypothetical protein
MGRGAAICQRSVTATLAVIVIAFATLFPDSFSNSEIPQNLNRPVLQAAIFPHAALIAKDGAKWQFTGVHLALLLAIACAIPNSSSAGFLPYGQSVAVAAPSLRHEVSRAPPQLLLFS